MHNTDDIALVNHGYRKPEEIRKTTVKAQVNFGAYMLCLNEHVVRQLGLKFIMKQRAQLANGEIAEVDIIGPVDVKFLNRSTNCRVMVIPGENGAGSGLYRWKTWLY